MSATGWPLGEFGDERLAKRGVCFCRRWWRGRASAFVVWRGGGVEESSDTRDFLRILG